MEEIFNTVFLDLWHWKWKSNNGKTTSHGALNEINVMKWNVFNTNILDFVQCIPLLKWLHFGKWKQNKLPEHSGLNKLGQFEFEFEFEFIYILLQSKVVLISSDNK
jgi:hypothetical protein